VIQITQAGIYVPSQVTRNVEEYVDIRREIQVASHTPTQKKSNINKMKWSLLVFWKIFTMPFSLPLSLSVSRSLAHSRTYRISNSNWHRPREHPSQQLQWRLFAILHLHHLYVWAGIPQKILVLCQQQRADVKAKVKEQRWQKVENFKENFAQVSQLLIFCVNVKFALVSGLEIFKAWSCNSSFLDGQVCCNVCLRHCGLGLPLIGFILRQENQ
jgi:hypothetical protein